MCEQKCPQEPKKKGFIQKWIDKLDKKMEEKARRAPCCGGSKDNEGSSCCNG